MRPRSPSFPVIAAAAAGALTLAWAFEGTQSSQSASGTVTPDEPLQPPSEAAAGSRPVPATLLAHAPSLAKTPSPAQPQTKGDLTGSRPALSVKPDGIAHGEQELPTSADVKARWASEPSNAAANKLLGSRMADALRALQSDPDAVLEVDCRTTLCRVALDLSEPETLSALQEAQDLEDFRGEQEMTAQSSGAIAAVLYVASE
jgi:hypothetical protein